MDTLTLGISTRSDRELLRLAAKAAGIGGAWQEYGYGQQGWLDESGNLWAPQDDDGAALRLAVTLSICIEFGYCLDDAPVVRCGQEWERENWPQDANFPDPNVATRRAIVRAAAAIGEKQ